jgi:hypothetical protein
MFILQTLELYIRAVQSSYEATLLLTGQVEIGLYGYVAVADNYPSAVRAITIV